MNKVGKRRPDKPAPLLIALRRGGVALPVKDCLLPGRKPFGHKAKLDKRAESKLPIAVHNKVQICKVVLDMTGTVRVSGVLPVLLIYSHIVAEKAVSPYMLKAYLLLNQL